MIKYNRFVAVALILTGVAIVSSAAPAYSAAPPLQRSVEGQETGRQETGRQGFSEQNGAAGAAQNGAEQTSQFTPTDLSAAALLPPRRDPGSKLDTGLATLAQLRDTLGDAAARLFARRRGLEWQAGSVRVRVDTGLPIPGLRVSEASSRATVEAALADLEAAGARVRTAFGPHIEAWVPVAALESLELQPAIRAIRRPWKLKPDAISEGVRVIGADRWDGVTFRSPAGGLRVGVIDEGFEGWERLRGTDLPPESRLVTKSFRDDGDLDADTKHGAAVAEIIYDLEPSATLYLAAVDSIGGISQAMTYFIDNNIDVINMSLGCIGCGPGDGRGAFVEIVERGPANGIPFVTSAGNQAQRHWMGTFIDSDGDGLNEFAPGDETNSFPGQQGDAVDVTLMWDFTGWFASTQDYDLLLLDSQGNIVDQSRRRQAGLPGQEAIEQISITLPFNDTFHVVVQDIATTAPQTLELFVDHRGLEYIVPDSSLTSPADGRQVIAVGAALWSNDVVESFSSRGPTKDGRMKPDLAAPDGVTTASFGPLNFFGTSAASPHVVGAIALLRGRLGLPTGPEAYRSLLARLVDLAPSGADNISGGGRLSLVPPG